MSVTLPKKRMRGRPTLRDQWSAASVESVCRAALEAHNLNGLAAPEKWTVKEAMALLALHGLDRREIARRFSQSENGVSVALNQWRAKHGMSLDEFRARVAENVAAHRMGLKATTLEPLSSPKTHEAELSETEAAEILEFVKTVGAAAVARELEAQSRPMTREQIDRLPSETYCSIMTDADVREAHERLYGEKRWER